MFAGFLLGTFSQRWGNVLKRTYSDATITIQTSGAHTISVTDRHLVTLKSCIDLAMETVE